METKTDKRTGNARLRHLAVVGGDAPMHEELRSHLKGVEPGWEVQSYRTGAEALEVLATDPPPQLVLLDETLPDGCGLQCAQRLKIRRPGLLVLIHAAQGCPDKLFKALVLCAVGYVVKTDGVTELVPHLRKAMEGGFTLCKQAEPLMLQALARLGSGNPWGLTRKEQEVMLWLCRNQNEKEISTRLGLTINTVHVHVKHAYKKLSVHNRRQAVKKYLPMIHLGG